MKLKNHVFEVYNPHRFIRLFFLALTFHLGCLLIFHLEFRTHTATKHRIASSDLPVTEISLETYAPSSKETSTSFSPSPPFAHSTSLPTKKRTISAAAHESTDTEYLLRWQRHIESVGNTYYPVKALQKNIQGQLRLLVAIRRDGSLHEVRLRQSSGKPILDKAAIEIVLKAAPFEPLPPEIAQDTEILEIIRTWDFRGKIETAL